MKINPDLIDLDKEYKTGTITKTTATLQPSGWRLCGTNSTFNIEKEGTYLIIINASFQYTTGNNGVHIGVVVDGGMVSYQTWFLTAGYAGNNSIIGVKNLSVGDHTINYQAYGSATFRVPTDSSYYIIKIA